MELLQQEKMAHVEELRQIHADINAVSFRSSAVDEHRCFILIVTMGFFDCVTEQLTHLPY